MGKIDTNTIKANVLQIIRTYPEAADDDAILLERYWVEFDGWDENRTLYWNLQCATRPETITRRRRELYNEGLIEYSKKALDDRTEAFYNEQDTHSQTAAIPWFND